MVDRTRNRSDKYQILLLESPYSSEMMGGFTTSDSIYSKLNPFGYCEEILELQEQLRMAFWRIVDTELTKRQAQVIHLTAEGLTQIEVARLLGVNQSSITKSLNGNAEYKIKTIDENDNKNAPKRKIYGGAKRKLMRIVAKDEEIQEILRKISDLQE